MQCDHDGFTIETFEAGQGLWHARIRRTDLTPVVIDGVLFSALEVGFAWSDPDSAIADAKTQIERLKLGRYATLEAQGERQRACHCGLHRNCPFPAAGLIPYSPDGEASRPTEKARQIPEIESAEFKGLEAGRAADRAGAGGTAQSRDQP